MTRFAGAIGFAVTVESTPGVWSETIIEHVHYGSVVKDTRNLRDGQNLNPDLSVSNSISIVASEYASEHLLDIRYARWMGVLWKVTDVEIQAPRLLLRLGEKYNGASA